MEIYNDEEFSNSWKVVLIETIIIWNNFANEMMIQISSDIHS